MTTFRPFAASAVFALFSLTVFAADLELNKEYPPADEAADIAKIAAGVKAGFAAQARLLAEGKIDKVRRDAHAKHHGCVNAKFEVVKDLPEELRHGVLKSQATYDAVIRFSNGAGNVRQADWIPDGRGMAFKLKGVEGDKLLADEKDSQDFLMINFPEFFVRNAKDYVAFFANRDAFFKDPKRKDVEARIAVSMASQLTTSPLEAQYFSMVPVRLGKAAIKYSAKPCSDKKTLKFGDLDLTPMIAILRTVTNPADLPKHAAALKPFENYLEEAMAYQLKEQDFCFDFLVQLQTDANKQRIEDATDHWDSPFHRVARISIPKQTFQGKGQDLACERMVLTPWHSVADHQPIGGIQRVRKVVYETSAKIRNEANKPAPVRRP